MASGAARRASIGRAVVACLAVLGIFAPSAWGASHVYVANDFSENISAYSVASNGGLTAVIGSPFASDGWAPLGVALSPNGEDLYVTDSESEGVSAYSIAADGSLSPVTGSPFATGTGPWGVAVSPDGAHLYVVNEESNSVSAYSIAADGSLSPVTGSPFSTGSAPRMGSNGVAVSSDGKHLYVTNQTANSVSAYSIAADGSLSPVTGSPFATGETPRAVSVSPDGKYLYLVNETSENISAYSVAADGSLNPVTGSPFSMEGEPLGVAVTSDGNHLYVAHVAFGNDVWGYSIAADGSLSPVAGSPFATGGIRGNSLAVSPDNSHLYTTNSTSKNVSAYSIAANGSLSLVAGSPFATGSGPLQIAVSPDQGPTAAFAATPTPATDPSSFDASASSDPDGTVASYRWDFGDGETQITPTPTIAHTYTDPGEYTVTLTVADDSGCSTTQTFTGQTVSCNGSPLAQISHQITVPQGVPLSVSLAGSGSVTSVPSGIACPDACSYAYPPDTQVVLTANPAPGSTFNGWSGGGCAGTSTCQLTIGADTDVTATFSKSIPSAKLTVTLVGGGSGSVADGIGAISCPPTCSYSYIADTQVVLAAAPMSGSRFAGWSGGGCSGVKLCQLMIGADTTLTATFEKTSPARSRLKIGRVREKTVGGPRCLVGRALVPRMFSRESCKLEIVVGGTIVKQARGIISIRASLHKNGQAVVRAEQTRIASGHWLAQLAFPHDSRDLPLYISARFAGSPGIQGSHARRRVG